METIVYSQSAHGKICSGCRRHKRDVMITFIGTGGNEFLDFFLTNEQAATLAKDINKRLQQNEYKPRTRWQRFLDNLNLR